VATTVTADLFVSVDGFAKGERSPGYFGYGGPELESWIADELARPQRILLGRRTYAALSEVPPEAQDDGYRQMTSTPATVFSRTLTHADWPGATIESGDAVAHVRGLKEGDDLPLRTMGSLSVVQQLLDAGLVDRLRLVVFPLLVGPSGREPGFAGVGETDLELVDVRRLDGRLVLLEYAPTGRPIP
jgi:dihydrofolate reductase